jgi:hypothetical protein
MGGIKKARPVRIGRQRLRDQAFARIGGYKCELCGCNEPLLLMVNHRQRDGAERRKRIKNYGTNLYKIILQTVNPGEVYRPLCASCNWLARNLPDQEVREIIRRQGFTPLDLSDPSLQVFSGAGSRGSE